MSEKGGSDSGGAAAAPAETTGGGSAPPKKYSRFSLHVPEKEDRGNWSSRVAFYMATMWVIAGG